jgi:hypothetical protein
MRSTFMCTEQIEFSTEGDCIEEYRAGGDIIVSCDGVN